MKRSNIFPTRLDVCEVQTRFSSILIGAGTGGSLVIKLCMDEYDQSLDSKHEESSSCTFCQTS